MVRLFQAARLNLSMAKMLQQLAGGKTLIAFGYVLKSQEKNPLRCRWEGGRKGTMKESTRSVLRHTPMCVCALCVTTHEVKAKVKRAIAFSQSGQWRLDI